MKEINHPNILHLHGFLESSSNYYIIVNYCNQGDMKQYIDKENDRSLGEGKAVYFLK